MAPAKSRYAPSGQTVATGRGLYIRRVRSEYSFPFVFSPRVILSASPLEQNRILGDTDLGEVAEAAPPTSDGSEGKFRWLRPPPQPLMVIGPGSLKLFSLTICGGSQTKSSRPATTRPTRDCAWPLKLLLPGFSGYPNASVQLPCEANLVCANGSVNQVTWLMSTAVTLLVSTMWGGRVLLGLLAVWGITFACHFGCKVY